MRAINLVNGTLRDELPPVRSVDELRRSRAHLEALGLGVGRDGILAASLAHFEELQAPVPTSTAEDMRAAVLGIVRQQHARRVGAPRDCPPSVPPAPPCRCCWHADFVGGARTKGQAGHDVDLLLWHHSEPNSWGPGAEQCLVLPLLGVLEASGRLLPPEEGRRQLVRRDHKAKQPDAATGERGYMKVKGPSTCRATGTTSSSASGARPSGCTTASTWSSSRTRRSFPSRASPGRAAAHSTG